MEFDTNLPCDASHMPPAPAFDTEHTRTITHTNTQRHIRQLYICSVKLSIQPSATGKFPRRATSKRKNFRHFFSGYSTHPNESNFRLPATTDKGPHRAIERNQVYNDNHHHHHQNSAFRDGLDVSCHRADGITQSAVAFSVPDFILSPRTKPNSTPLRGAAFTGNGMNFFSLFLWRSTEISGRAHLADDPVDLL